MCDRLYLLIMRLVVLFFSISFNEIICVMSPQMKSSALGLYRCFKALSRFSINLLKSPLGAVCKLNIIYLDDLVSSSTCQIAVFFSLQLRETLILLKYGSLRTKIHTPRFCRFLWHLSATVINTSISFCAAVRKPCFCHVTERL